MKNKKPKVKYVSKSKFPNPNYEGMYLPDGRIYVRKGLSKPVKKFVLEHEKGHLVYWNKLKKKGKANEEDYNWLLGETYANWYGLLREPLGFLICAITIFKPSRLKSIYNLFKNKGKVEDPRF